MSIQFVFDSIALPVVKGTIDSFIVPTNKSERHRKRFHRPMSHLTYLLTAQCCFKTSDVVKTRLKTVMIFLRDSSVVSVRSFLLAAMTWYSGLFLSSVVTRFARDIGQLARICRDLRFIWCHHHQWVYGYQYFIWSYSLLHRADETQQGRNSCPRLQFLAFSLDSIMSLPR